MRMQTTIRCLRSLLILSFAIAVQAAAQAPTTTPDVPGGAGRVEGRVEPSADTAIVGDAEVILYSLSEEGEPGLRRGKADKDGTFRFENIDANPGIVYLVGARIEGVPFGARFSFAEGQVEAEVLITVSAPTAVASDLAAGEIQIVLAQGCRDLRVQQTHQVHNPSGRVVFVPPNARSGAKPPLEIILPEGASAIETPLGNLEGFERDGRTLRFWGPVYASGQRVEIGYGLPLASETFELGLPAGAESVRVFTPKAGLHVTSAELTGVGDQQLPIGLHDVQQTGPLAAGHVLRLTPENTDLPAGSVASLGESRMWIELDDALVDINEVHQIENPNSTPLVSKTGAPVVCIGLPDGAEDLRFSNDALALGLSRDPSGALALQGPLPPGNSTFALRYQLPVLGDRASVTRRFESDVPLLTVLVADTGLIPHTKRLHRKRPVRTPDRSYLHLEGFALGADEEFSLELERLQTRPRWPALASSGVLFVAALAALAFLSAPLRRGEASAEPQEDDISTARAAIYAAIDALDEDFETGKLSTEDHGRMRAEMRNRAVRLLQTEREPPKPTSNSLVCSACDTPFRVGDHFCAKCGQKLAGEEPSQS